MISTLWSVSDEVTPDWMSWFYRSLAEGRTRATAVHDARLAVRARHPHPYYWASFILEGDIGPIDARAPSAGGCGVPQ